MYFSSALWGQCFSVVLWGLCFSRFMGTDGISLQVCGD